MNITQETIDKALVSGKNYAQGTTLALMIGSPLHLEMQDLALVTAKGNLTRKGSIAAQQATTAALDALFGAL